MPQLVCNAEALALFDMSFVVSDYAGFLLNYKHAGDVGTKLGCLKVYVQCFRDFCDANRRGRDTG